MFPFQLLDEMGLGPDGPPIQPPLCSLWCTALVSGTPQSQTSCFSLRLWLHPLMTRESACSNVQHCFNATGLVAALRHYCCPSYPFSNLLSDEPPPMKLPPETDLSESMAAEKEAGAELSSAKAGERTKAAETDKRSATLKSRC